MARTGPHAGTPALRSARRSLEKEKAEKAAAEGKEAWQAFLAPIKDLAENWNIDLARDLEDYLDEVASIHFDLGDGVNETLNFAQAAVIIQGSACVYSKKVEYLHGLVYATLSHITDTKREAARRNGNRADGAGSDDEDLPLEDDEDDFLNLDDVIEEGQGIDLDDAGKEDEEDEPAPRALSTCAAALREGVGMELASDNQSFKVAVCAMHSSGALLLDAHEEVAGFDGDGAGTLYGAHDDDDDDDDDDGGLPPPMADDDDGALPYPMADNHDGDVVGLAAGQLGAEQREESQDRGDPEEEEEKDYWAQADPHAESVRLRLQPFRRGARPRLRVAHEALADAAELGEALVKVEDADQLEGDAAVRTAALECYQALCVWEVKKHLAIRERQARRAARKVSGAAAEAAGDEAPGAAAAGGADPNDEDVIDDDVGGFDVGFGGLDDDDDDDFDHAGADFGAEDDVGALHAHASTSSQRPAESYEELVRRHVAAIVEAAAAEERQSELGARVNTWRTTMEAELEVEQKAGTFDIEAAGERVLARLEDEVAVVGEKRPAEAEEKEVEFGKVASGATPKEVARLFAAVLQLAVDGRVSLEATDGDTAGGADERGFTRDFRVARAALEAAPKAVVPKRARNTSSGKPLAEVNN